MISLTPNIKKHSIGIYFLLTFAISWGCMNMLITPYSFPLTAEQSDTVGPLLYVGMLVGPSIAGLLLIGLVDGKSGYSELLSRLTKWRVSIKWYLAAILGTPLLATLILIILSQFFPVYTPALFTNDDKAGLIMMGLGVGLMVGFFEELGWTGFVVPKMRFHNNIQTTGLIVGLLWGAWHFPPFWKINSFSGAIPLSILLVQLFAWLPPYRTLMVWVHDQTKSLLITILMHASLVFTTLTLPSMELSGAYLIIWLMTWGLSLLAMARVVTNSRHQFLFQK